MGIIAKIQRSKELDTKQCVDIHNLVLMNIDSIVLSDKFCKINQIIIGETTEDTILYFNKYKSLPQKTKEIIESKLFNRVLDPIIILGKKIDKAQAKKIIYFRDNKKKLNQSQNNFGKKANQYGKIFEQECAKAFNIHGKYKDQIIEEILKNEFIGYNNSEIDLTAKRIGDESILSFVDGKKSKPKADIQLFLTNSRNLDIKVIGLSCKNTCKTTQASSNTVSSFIKILFKKYNIIVPEFIAVALNKFCGVSGYTPQELEPTRKVKQAKNNRYLLHELDDVTEVIDWFQEHQQIILDMLLFKGGTIDPNYHADYIVSSIIPISDKNLFIGDIKIENRQSLLDKAKTEPVRVSRDFGSIQLGVGTGIKRKGSGDTQASRSGLQTQRDSSRK